METKSENVCMANTFTCSEISNLRCHIPCMLLAKECGHKTEGGKEDSREEGGSNKYISHTTTLQSVNTLLHYTGQTEVNMTQ
jgi:hypothetical protein